jgi:hypothetical protein
VTEFNARPVPELLIADESLIRPANVADLGLIPLSVNVLQPRIDRLASTP